MIYDLQQDIRDINTQLFLIGIIDHVEYFKIEEAISVNDKLFKIHLN